MYSAAFLNLLVLFNTAVFISRSSHGRCSVEKVFLEISQNSQENTCARASFLIKLQASDLRWLLLYFWTPKFRFRYLFNFNKYEA